MRRSIFLVLTLSAFAPSVGRSQSNWDRYKPGTLSSIVTSNNADIATACDTLRPCTIISAKDFATAAHVSFLGEWRPLSPAVAQQITVWAKTVGIDTAVAATFGQELHVREDTLEYWLPIQSVLVDDFKKEVPAGHGVTLLAMFLGGYLERDATPQWVFLVNEFQADD